LLTLDGVAAAANSPWELTVMGLLVGEGVALPKT